MGCYQDKCINFKKYFIFRPVKIIIEYKEKQNV
jgi:hypothetical protein